MADSSEPVESNWSFRSRIDEELEFYTDMALHETQRWIEAVTRKKFAYPDDPRKSLENGVLLCELLNCLRPGSVRRINRLPTPIAGIDNLNVFLEACEEQVGLKNSQLFNPSELQDLSTRAIADTDQIKQEIEKRLRSVAITVYWLGKTVEGTYNGPQLDFSAFTGLIKNQGTGSLFEHTPRAHTRQDSADSYEHSSAYGSYRSEDVNHKTSTPGHHSNTSYDSVEQPRFLQDISTGSGHHQRENSYDSFGSFDRHNSDDNSFENMPVRNNMQHYGSAGNLSHSGQLRYSATLDGLYSDEVPSMQQKASKFDVHHRSNPDLTKTYTFGLPAEHQGRYRSGSTQNIHHQRFSSTDSLDGNSYGNHSRQSSGSSENAFSKSVRRTSTANLPYDPLQFIKVGKAPLAEEAKETITLVKEVKELKKKIEHEDEDWQSNLSSWKQRRRSKSSHSYQVKEDLDNMFQEEEPKSGRGIKSFAEMRKEREARRSFNYFPYNDGDEDENVFSNIPKREDRTEKLDWRKEKSKSMDLSSYKQDKKSEEKEDRGSKLANLRSRYEDLDSAKMPPPRSPPKPAPRKPKQEPIIPVEDVIVESNHKHSHDGSHSESSTDVEAQNKRNKATEREIIPTSTASLQMVPKKQTEEEEEEETEESEEEESEDEKDKSKPLSQPFRPFVSSNSRGSLHGMVEEKVTIVKQTERETTFGFTLKGGRDQCAPLVVDTVNVGSSADVCGLDEGDEVISVNGDEVAELFRGSVMLKVNQSLKKGKVEIIVRRTKEASLKINARLPLKEPEAVSNKLVDYDSESDSEKKTEKETAAPQVEEQQVQTQVQPVENGLSSPPSTDTFTSEDEKQREKDAEVTRIKKENIKRRSDFLGLEKDTVDSGAKPLTSTWPPKMEVSQTIQLQKPAQNPPQTSHEVQATVGKEFSFQVQEDKSKDIEAKEREIIENLEREEQLKNINKSASLPAHARAMSMEHLRSVGTTSKEIEIESRVAKDFESALQQQPRKSASLNRRSFFSIDEERKRMEEWGKEQERRRQPSHRPFLQKANTVASLKEQYEREQQQLQEQYKKDQQRAQELKINLVQPQQQKQQEKKSTPLSVEAKPPQQTSNFAPYQWTIRAQQQQPVESEKDRNLKEEEEKRKVQEEQERLDRELKERQKEEEEEKMRLYNLENQRREEERRQEEMERKKQEELEIQKLKDREDQLKMMEERLRQEQEKLRMEAERLRREKSDRQKQWDEQEEDQTTQEQEPVQRPQQPKLASAAPWQEPPKKFSPVSFKKDSYVNYPKPFSRSPDHQEVHRSSWEQPAPNFLDNRGPFERNQGHPEEPIEEKPVARVMTPPQKHQAAVISPEQRLHQLVHTEDNEEVPQPKTFSQQLQQPKPSKLEPVMTREDVLKMSRNPAPTWRPSQPEQTTVEGVHKPVAVKSQDEDPKKNRPNINAVPKTRLLKSDGWILSEDERQKKQKRRSEIMRKQGFNPQEHWVVQEAERRRLAEQNERERLQKLQSRHSAQGPSNAAHNKIDQEPFQTRDDSQKNWNSLHSEQPQPKRDASPPLKPIPDSIKQSLMDRVSSTERISPPRSPTRPTPQPAHHHLQQPETSQTFRSPLIQIQPQQSKPAYQQQRWDSQDAPSITSGPQPMSSRQPPTPEKEPPPPPAKPPRSAPGKESRKEPVDPSVLSVSGKQKCSHCNKELGRGAAMVIESLNLFYHVQCFRCCVCHAALGNGSTGADVRVRVSKLHCKNCYSNDEAGLKYSAV
ncbi:LIM and calponin homology domains-containing protein 1 isoform X3 [Lingula anatina]|uniref:LIM and calponin homology domains-containing protein 1 isoform X3 n=1 Tax=Lingula anatina TaxID=7574 RepID=A0A1S3HER7_LINAN|nr:LIM and calponin homology domains-containing protein 1 isoform X3 [Lingula anatina]|eukprot:XP_013384558.1 LIM and calponin homology domains-containing protein 1 isoform X3 [Lingula anatina]